MFKNPPANAGDARNMGSIPGSGRSTWRRKQQPAPAFLPGKFLGQRNLGGYYSPVHGVAKSWIQLSNKHTHIYITVHI